MECRACRHPNRDAIDRELVSGVPLRDIVASSGLSLGGLVRHKDHVREMIKERLPAERAEHGSVLLDRVGKLADRAEALLAVAESKSNVTGATSALNACVRVLELIAKLTGELQPANTGGIHLSLTKVSNTTTINYNDDLELAELVFEATGGFDVDEIMRLKSLATSSVSDASVTELSPPRLAGS
jgi:hypothetical protein